MKHKFLSKLSIIAVACVMAIAIFAGCTTTDADNGNNNGGNEPIPPSQDTIWLIELGNILANTIKLNPSNGFLMDLSAETAFAFNDASKQRYNWGYTFNIKGNVFVDGELKQGMMIELRSHLKTVMDADGIVSTREYTEEEIAAGEDILLGIYNDAEGALWFQAGTVKYHFTSVNASVAIKTLLATLGVDLDFNVEDIKINDYALGEYLPSIVPLLSIAFENLNKTENSYTFDMNFSSLYSVVDMLISQVAGSSLEDLLGADTIKKLPKEILMKVEIQTDGTILKGVDVLDAKVNNSENVDEGVFDIDTNFTLFGAPASSVNVADYVNDNLKAVVASKVFNLSAKGNIQLLKENAEVGSYQWKINANLDLIKMLEHNFNITGDVGNLLFSDNFLHFSLAQGTNPVLDLIYAPDQMGDTDLTAIIHLNWLLNLLNINLGSVIMAGLPEYFVMPISPDAIVNLIGGTSDGGNGGNGGNGGESGGSGTTPEAPNQNDIIETVKNIISKFVIQNQEMTIDIKGLLSMVELPASIQPMLDKLLFGADTARCYDTSAVFAGEGIKDYNILNDVKYKTDGSTERKWTGLVASNSNVYNKEFETANGFLKLYAGSGSNDVMLDASLRPVSVEELDAMMGNAAARYIGTRMKGNAITSFTSSNDIVVVGYKGLNPLLIGEEQTIIVYAKTLDASGLLKTAAGIAAEVKSILDMPLIAYRAKVILGEIDEITDLALLIDGQPIAPEKVFTVGDKFDNLSLTATVKYKPNKAYLEGATISTATVPGIAKIEKINATLVTANGQKAVAAQGAFTVDVSVCGRPFQLGFQAETATSIEVTQNNNVYQGGTNLPNADELAKLFDLKFNYSETSITGVRLSGADVVWVNMADWSEAGFVGNIVLNKEGVMHLKLKVNGVLLEGDWYVTVTDYVPDYKVEYREMTFEGGSVNGNIAITGFANTYGGTHDVGAELKLVVREFQTNAVVDTYTVNYQSDRLTFAGGLTTLPYTQFGDAIIINYAIAGLNADLNYTLEFVVFNEETGRNIAALEQMALKNGIRFNEAGKNLKANDYILGKAVLMLKGAPGIYTLRGGTLGNATDIRNYQFGDYGGNSKVSISGKDTNGNDMTVLNKGTGFLGTTNRGKIFGGLNGTVTITFEYNGEYLTTTQEIHT